MRRSLLLLCLCVSLVSCGKSSSSKDQTLKIAASSVPQADLLHHVKKTLAQEGITLDIIEIDDYNIPNRALADGEVDANFFQHEPFLEEQIKQFHYPFCILAKIHIEPMGIYSKKAGSLDNLTKSGMIAIPNDPTNEARALLLLENAGLITLKKQNVYHTTIRDVTENPYGFTFKEVDSALLPHLLSEVTAAVIPTNYALLAGLSPLQNALYKEDKSSLYTNVIVVRCADKDTPKLLALKQCMTSEEMRAYLLSKYEGAVFPAF